VSHLRHYHDVGLLQPAYIDPESGYRYYAAAQSDAAEVIGILRSIDMPVRDIQRLLADPSEANVREVLGSHRARLEDRLLQVAGRLESIDRIVKEGKLMKQPSGVHDGRRVKCRRPAHRGAADSGWGTYTLRRLSPNEDVARTKSRP